MTPKQKMRLVLTSILSPAILAFNLPVQSADFELTFEGVPENARSDIQTAAEIIGACLVSNVPIRARVTWIERGPTGFAYQGGIRNEPFLPKRNVWYPTALANALAGERLRDEDDINIFLSASTNWYFDSGIPIAEGQTDLLGVTMHEIVHGLGLSTSSFTPWQGEPLTALGLPNDFVNYFDYSFTLHELDGTMSVYDSFLQLADGRRLSDFENNSLDLTMAIANRTLHFTGERATALNDGFPVAVEPLSISHIPEPPRGMEPLMLANSGQGIVRRTNDPLALAMLADLGWVIEDACLPITPTHHRTSR